MWAFVRAIAPEIGADKQQLHFIVLLVSVVGVLERSSYASHTIAGGITCKPSGFI
ncbi:MAG: hypothetical protein F6K09_07890 [Merismopedia sp. SIO2A8]|nr:hypothetical protein [Symploca sp. SIO2B6]NET48634.1 hypothetical protein [Merismopedia sp. SIO2A8]